MIVYVLHIQSESAENYYRVFAEKPDKKQIFKIQKEIYESEYGEVPDSEYFTDLVSVQSVSATEVIGD